MKTVDDPNLLYKLFLEYFTLPVHDAFPKKRLSIKTIRSFKSLDYNRTKKFTKKCLMSAVENI